MLELIMVLLALVVLIPILYYLPLGYNLKGKLLLTGIACLLAVAGILAVQSYPVWGVLLVLILLIFCSTYFIQKKMSPLLFSHLNNEEVAADLEKDLIEIELEDILQEEEEIVLEKLIEIDPEIAILKNSDTIEEEQADVMKELNLENILEKRDLGSLLEEDSPSVEEDLVESLDEANTIEIDMVHSTEVADQEVQVEEEEDLEALFAEILNDETFLEKVNDNLKNEEEIDGKSVGNERFLRNPMEIVEDITENKEDTKKLEGIDDPIVDIHQANENVAAGITEMTPKVDAVPEDIHEDLLLEEWLSKFEEDVEEDAVTEEIGEADIDEEVTEDKLVEALVGEGTKDSKIIEGTDEADNVERDSITEELDISVAEVVHVSKEELTNKDEEIYQIEEELPVERAVKPVAHELFQTILAQIHFQKQTLSAADYEIQLREYIKPVLHDQDYFTFATLLMNHFVEQEKYTLLDEFLSSIDARFSEYPVLSAQLQFYKDWLNNN
ncbi:hypothetical protein [Bacillus sp. 2205SS5-2]|uniref:hypothetical protein n=1 Tax=Bacillus sp. 2205SS5-2 TaxID=3109031 RepID=UPI0030052C02